MPLVRLYLTICKVHGDLKGVSIHLHILPRILPPFESQANILVTDDGSLQLTDFGLTIIHGAMVQFSKSAGQVGGGTLRWMAPELVFGNEASQDSGNASRSMSEALTMAKESDVNNDAQPKLCKATDIYALGMTMLEILTGKRPFKELDKDVAVILALDKGNRPRRPKRILEQSPRGALFWDILQKCWAQTPEDRPAANVVDTLILSLCSG
ncbi:kinase-like protein [Ceratobasidium sp. AG-I]|nr:kinase-like protein [Ceratobasidium sp. AG-I]